MRLTIGSRHAQLIILGKQAIDDDSNQTGQMLAALLGWGQATFASRVVIEDGKATVTREVDGGLENVKPAHLGVDVTPRLKTLKVSEPPKRFAGIMAPDVATLVAKLRNEAKVI